MPQQEFDWITGCRPHRTPVFRSDAKGVQYSPDRRLLLMNGPNLNLLGQRDPTQYVTFTLNDVEAQTTAAAHAAGYALDCFQSNHEGELVDLIQAASVRYCGIILNAGR
jgi:3-dehydroquinate dehydratase-2